MIKIKFKIYLIIFFTIYVTFFTACSTKNNPGNSSNNKETLLSDARNNVPEKLSWYINAEYFSKKWNSKGTLFDSVVTEKTGADIDIRVPVGNSDQKIAALAISGQLPDIITIDNWNGTSKQLMKAGYFEPLNKLAEKYSPELLKIIPGSMKKMMTQADGNWYGITNYFLAPEWFSKDSFIENPNGVIAQEDIMKKLGIKASDFDTQAGTIKALEKVKNAKLSINNKKIIPICIQWNDWVLARMWGIPWETKNGDWEDYLTNPKCLEIYKFLNTLWRDGLISKDNFTTWSGEKIKDGECFAYLGNMDDVGEPLREAFRNEKIRYLPVGPIHALDGATPVFDQAGMGWTTTYITKNCKDKKLAIKLLTYLASDEGQMLTWFGVKGTTYELVKGKVRFTNEYLNMKHDDPQMADKVYGVGTFWPLLQNLFYQKFIDYSAVTEEEKNYNNIVRYFSGFSKRTPETMALNPDNGTVEASMNDELKDYWSNVTRSMVLSKSSREVEKIFNQYLEHINELGYKRVYNISNNKFKAMKAKLGVKQSFPYKQEN